MLSHFDNINVSVNLSGTKIYWSCCLPDVQYYNRIVITNGIDGNGIESIGTFQVDKRGRKLVDYDHAKHNYSSTKASSKKVRVVLTFSAVWTARGALYFI